MTARSAHHRDLLQRGMHDPGERRPRANDCFLYINVMYNGVKFVR